MGTMDRPAKAFIKAVKKRLQNKNSKVRLLVLMFLETMIKNCGDFVHFQVLDREILQEMVKMARKARNMQVREKILVLLEFWQGVLGGPHGKYPQFYKYAELKASWEIEDHAGAGEGPSQPEYSPYTEYFPGVYYDAQADEGLIQTQDTHMAIWDAWPETTPTPASGIEEVVEDRQEQPRVVEDREEQPRVVEDREEQPRVRYAPVRYTTGSDAVYRRRRRT